jgi:hypothetical protein
MQVPWSDPIEWRAAAAGITELFIHANLDVHDVET